MRFTKLAATPSGGAMVWASLLLLPSALANAATCLASIQTPSFQNAVNYRDGDNRCVRFDYTYSPGECVWDGMYYTGDYSVLSSAKTGQSYSCPVSYDSTGSGTAKCSVARGDIAESDDWVFEIWSVAPDEEDNGTRDLSPFTITHDASRPYVSANVNQRRGLGLDAGYSAQQGFGTGSVPSRLDKLSCGTNAKLCPIPGRLGSWECIKTDSDLYSCGGCAPYGVDCTQIPYADAVDCVNGKCIVTACQRGYTLATDGSQCVGAR